MTATDLWASWRLWLMVAGAVVLIAAALLVTIWLTARSIRHHALRALHAAEQIRDHTSAIWALQSTNDVASQLLDTVESLEAKGDALAGALGSPAGAGGIR